MALQAPDRVVFSTLRRCKCLPAFESRQLRHPCHKPCRHPAAVPRAVTLDRPSSADPVAGLTAGRSLQQSATGTYKDAQPVPDVESAHNSEAYNWNRQWYPAIPVSYLDPARPHPLTLLGKRLALWHDSILGWRAVEDRCPHRLAPLSEGRVEQTAEGTRLACAYHGWEFDAAGACTRIPQLADPKAASTASNSPRSCVANYPVRVVGGLLFAWLDATPEGLAAAAEAPPPWVQPEAVTMPGDWIMNEVPNDYSFWQEQGMDPAHANFLHHRPPAFSMEQAVPMRADLVPDSTIDLQNGFTWTHRGYEEKNKDMRAVREFHPPTGLRSAYDMPNGMRTVLCTYYVPVSPGRCRTFFKIAFGRADAPPPPAAASAAAMTATTTTTLSAEAAASIGAAANLAQLNAEQPGAELTDSASEILNKASTNGDVSNGKEGQAGGGSANGAGASSAAAAASAPAAAVVPVAHGPARSAEKEQSVGNKLLMFLLGKAMKVAGKVPHWVIADQQIGDQDVVMMVQQEAFMREQGLTYKDYALFARSDEGVIAINKWMRRAGYGPDMWAAQMAGQASYIDQSSSGKDASSSSSSSSSHSNGSRDSSTSSSAPNGTSKLDLVRQQRLLAGGGGVTSSNGIGHGSSVGNNARMSPLTLEQILDRQERHVKHCMVCQQGLQTVNKFCAGLGAAFAVSTLASLASLSAAWSTATVTGQALQPISLGQSALFIGLAVLFGVLLTELWDFRTERFISGLPKWQARGGLSLVPRS